VLQLTADDAIPVAMVHRASFDERLPWLAGLHTPEEDLHYFREKESDVLYRWVRSGPRVRRCPKANPL